ncbi:soluble cytochrome b562 [Izhakiella capsodis]|uniref:Soluble cytochrome b562 n=1 Tax=Izhakiella capsodis TaxID=1367852 RepID=A0A1I4VU09_9GAMM|nr:cytochrome b562 [Izhakiella capsodis]SFN04680.1 soluble cytochrome b562 [Izhakiella capsodis]
MRKPVIAMLSASLLFTSTSALADLGKEMDIMKDSLSTVKKTRDAGELRQALTAMRQAAQDAKDQAPERLDGKAKDSAQIKDYRAHLDKLISQIDVSLKKVNAGDVAGAKAESENFEQTRNESHKKFR